MIRPESLRTRLALPALAIALALTPVAASAQGSEGGDSRLVTLVFDEAQVYTIKGKVRVQTTIKFAPDEVIQNVAIGDSTAWQVQPNQAQSILFVKPLEPNATTNMTVVTSRRTYLFDLVSSPRNAPLYVLQFRYPDIEKAEEEAALAAAAAAERDAANPVEIAAASDPFAVADPALLNFAWQGDGKAALLPSRVYDNGEVLFLTWPSGTAIPAILITNDDGDEGPANFTVRGDTIVLDMVPRAIVLRSGRDTATLTNNGPAPTRSVSVADTGARGS